MSTTMTIEVSVPFLPVGRCGGKALRPGGETPALPPGRVPRVARLMALALRLEELVRTGQVGSYSALASLGQVTRARVSQIMNFTQSSESREPPTSSQHRCGCTSFVGQRLTWAVLTLLSTTPARGHSPHSCISAPLRC
jgi:hypothetical protein